MNSKALVYASNDGYAWLLGISLISVLENTKDRDFDAFVLADGIGDDNKAHLFSIGNSYGIRVELIDVKTQLQELADEGVIGYGNALDGGLTAYARVFIDRLLPVNIDTIIYMDCDTMAGGDISRLFSEDLGDKAVGLCFDLLRNEYKKVVKIDTHRAYYNSGVMLMNRKIWRAKNCEKILLDEMLVGKAYPLVDQDVINISLFDEIKQLPSRYNWLSSMFLYSYKGNKRVYGLKENYWLAKESFERDKEDVVIYHFAGMTFGRPWFANSIHPMKAKYDEYLAISPWSEQRLQECKFDMPRKIQHFLYKLKCDSFASFVGCMMQRVFIYLVYKV